MTVSSVLWTIAFVVIIKIAAHSSAPTRQIIGYAMFFATPALSAVGLIGPLTGFDRTNASNDLFGLSFVTPLLALLLLTDTLRLRTSPVNIWFIALNPVFLTSGPIPRTGRIRPSVRTKVLWRRLRVVQSDMIVGLFFISIAKSFSPLLAMKSSVQPIDVLLFGALFEAYVYFNFAGYTMMAWGILRLMGIDAPRNFSMPFCSTSVVEYWRRWHISLGNVIRELFFRPFSSTLGVYGAATLCFMASAIWHGVTLNFVAWGVLHALCWGLSRWLFVNQGPVWAQILLLIFSVVFGRVLFAESDTELLVAKLTGLFCLDSWRETGHALWILSALTMKNSLALILAFWLLLSEHWFAKRRHQQRYQHLKSPTVSTALLACIVFLGNFADQAPIYGQR